MSFVRVIAGGLLAIGGCASPGAVEAEAPSPRAEATRQLMEHMLNTDNGLLLRRWVVTDDRDRVGAALTAFRDGAAVDQRTERVLRQDGLRLVRVRAESLEPLLSGLGIAPLDVSAWHGQVVEWRELLARPVVPGDVVAVGGLVRTVDRGALRLMARSWTVAMEDGAYLYVEMLPQLRRPQPLSLEQWLGGRSHDTESFERLMVAARLEQGFAYVLTGEAPATEWGGRAAADAEDSAPAEAPPETAVGPAAPTPDTLGEFLFLETGEPPLRTLLVLVPRIPARLNPGTQSLVAAH